MNLQIFLENKELELDNTVQFPLNKVYENLSNPTEIINEWSKQIKIPFSQKNCKILGNAYRLDRIISVTSAANIGLSLDPSRKIPMKMIYNGELVLDGYAKFVNANVTEAQQYFTIALFGKLGDVFNKLMDVKVSKTQLQESGLDDSYLLDDGITETKVLNANYVWNCWNDSTPNTENPFYYNVLPHQIIGFAPSYRGEYANFDTGKIQISDTEIIDTQEYFKNVIYNRLTGNAGYTPDGANAVIAEQKPEELAKLLTKDYQWGEWRSYNMRPYVYFNKLMYMYMHKCEELTGYKIKLDTDWFNDRNPYWTRMCYMMDFLENKKDKSEDISISSSDGVHYSTDKEPDAEQTKPYFGFSYTKYGNNVSGKSNLYINPFTITVHAKSSYRNLNGLSPVMYTNLYPSTLKGPVEIKITVSDNVNGILTHVDDFYLWSGSEKFIGSPSERIPGYKRTAATMVEHSQWNSVPNPSFKNERKDYYNIPMLKLKSGYVFKGIMTLDFTVYISGSPQANTVYFDGQSPVDYPVGSTDLSVNYDKITAKTNYSSGLNVKLENFYFSDKPLFNVILQYTKMFGLQWNADYASNTIFLSTRKNIFKNFKKTDWNNKINKTKDFIVEPVAFPTQHILFNYENKEGYRYTAYNDKYGMPYGQKIISTSYKFNTDKHSLFEGIDPSCVATNTFLKYTDIALWAPNVPVKTTPDDKVMMCCENDEQKSSVSMYNWFLRGNNTEGVREYITDDTPLMIRYAKSCWISPAYAAENDVYTEEWPNYSIVYTNAADTYGCVFNAPQEDYTYDKSVSRLPGKCIYDRYWHDYIDERYNIQNKKVTCYVNITPTEYMKLKPNDFVTLSNQLFMINKIFDFDLNTENISTKVELIQITDPSKYLTTF